MEDAVWDIATLRSMIRATERPTLWLALESLVRYYGENQRALLAFENASNDARRMIKALILAA
jgi:hypothetical protein